MLMRDLDNTFSNKVKKYLDKGYTIYTPTMSGLQGEMGKVDVTDGKNIYRIFMKKEYKSSIETIHICVGMDNKVKPYKKTTYEIVWNSNLKIIEDDVYYVYGNYYSSDEEEIKKMRKKASERMYESLNTDKIFIDVVLNKSSSNLILNKVHSMPKCKSIKEITSLKKYKVEDNNYKYVAHCLTSAGTYKSVFLW